MAKGYRKIVCSEDFAVSFCYVSVILIFMCIEECADPYRQRHRNNDADAAGNAMHDFRGYKGGTEQLVDWDS